MGMDDLIAAIGLAAEMLDLKAPINAPARACVLECSQQQGLGLVVNVVVRSGTISVGDIIVCGTECIKVRALLDERGEKRQSCGPSTPVSVVGFKELDAMGTVLRGVASEEEGKVIISEREATQQALDYEKVAAVQTPAEPPAEDARTLRAIVKASTKGALEAFMKYVNALPQDEVKILVLKSGVGPIHEGDVQMASLLGAKLFGFGLSVPEAVADAARRKAVMVHTREIIYQLMDDFRDAVAKELPPVEKQDVVGTAEVLQVFKRDGKKRQIIFGAGCRVTSGKLVSRDSKGKIHFRVLRDGVQVFQSGLERLFHFKDEVQSIDKGHECCLVLQDGKDYEPADVIECVCTSLVPPVFDDSAGRAS
jgi:translation initiation factor IF-2